MMKGRRWGAMALAILMALLNSATAATTLRLEVPVRVESWVSPAKECAAEPTEAPVLPPESADEAPAEPAPEAKADNMTEEHAKSMSSPTVQAEPFPSPQENQETEAAPAGKNWQLALSSRAEISEIPLRFHWEMDGPLSWTLREDELVEPSGETPVRLVVENLCKRPLWVNVLDNTGEETALVYLARGYEIPRNWTGRFLLMPGETHILEASFIPVEEVALKESETAQALPPLSAQIQWEDASVVDVDIYTCLFAEGDMK